MNKYIILATLYAAALNANEVELEAEAEQDYGTSPYLNNNFTGRQNNFGQQFQQHARQT